MGMTLDDFLERAPLVRDTAELWQLAVAFFGERDIQRISYHHKTQQGDEVMATEGFPQDWVCQYLEEKLILIDPMPELAQISMQPFQWSDVENFMALSPEQKDYMKRAHAADLGDGVAMQVFGPGFRNGYFGLGFGEGHFQRLTRLQIAVLQIAAQMTHACYCDLTPQIAHGVELSRREREVLNLVARGKSNLVIADILGISRHTVGTLLRRIYDKLEVTDRTSAAIRGVGAGLIQMPPLN
jgi:LuxR family transcriptional regulator/LuxR family quorum-sensing system transcriptional regulator CciR